MGKRRLKGIVTQIAWDCHYRLQDCHQRLKGIVTQIEGDCHHRLKGVVTRD